MRAVKEGTLMPADASLDLIRLRGRPRIADAEQLVLAAVTTMPLDETRPPFDAIRSHIINMVKALEGPTGNLVRGVIGACAADPEMSGILRERYLGHRRAPAIRIIKRGLLDGSFTASGSAEMLHDTRYGSIWYRFLFEVGSLSRKQALALSPQC
jgi:hypothetical protein